MLGKPFLRELFGGNLRAQFREKLVMGQHRQTLRKS
ncbi:hypothetical protein C100_14895 [Sphingobium sp. C100]|nr:hypothetical protein C100_14895 [Sphingobium sp. C100]